MKQHNIPLTHFVAVHPTKAKGLLTEAETRNRLRNGKQAKAFRGRMGKTARNRREREILLQKLLCAENEAYRKGFKGMARFDCLKRTAGLDERTEDRQVRRMLKEARQLFAKAD